MRELLPRQMAALKRAGAELRQLRERADLAQQDVSDVMGWVGRDACSKLENGRLNISLVDYLELAWWYRDLLPSDHPAILLYRALFQPPAATTT